MTAEIGKFFVKDIATTRDDYLRTTKNALAANGVINPQVGPGSEPYMRATAIANEIGVLNSNAQIKCDAMMPDTATGDDPDGIDDLARIGAAIGLKPRGAAPSHGSVVFTTSAASPVAVSSQLQDSNNLLYKVSVGGIYGNGALIPILAISGGDATNHIPGDTLRWVSAPAYSAPTVAVATGGLSGGFDKEDVETFRARVLNRFQNPPAAGNWPQIAQLAEDASTVVQKAFVYPAVNGPGTMHVAVVGYATAAAKTRDVDATILSSVIAPAVAGQISEYVEVVTTTVTNQPTDLSIGLSLPASTAAVPAGSGGGWTDGTPWPSGLSATGQQYANVTSVASATVITVNAPTPAINNVSSIAYLSPTDWKLYTAKVLLATGSAGAIVLTLDTPWPNVAADLALGGTGPLIFPQALNMQAYVDAFLAFCKLMGPGEKTTDPTVLTRGYRHPLPSQSWVNTFGAQALKALSNAGDEVLDEQWFYRTQSTPSVPVSVAGAPFQLIPRHFAMYAL